MPLLALAGCVLRDPPSSDELQLNVSPETGLPAEWTGAAAPGGPVEDDWLAAFADAQLEVFVAEALAHNADLQAAAARVEQAAGYVQVARSGLFPTLDILGRAGGELGDNSGLEGAIITSSWELDVWGRVRYDRRGTQAQYAASRADFRFARQSLAAMVAKSWFLATEASLQLDLVTEMLAAAENLLEIAEQRLRIGVGDELDVASSRLSVETYRDSVRQLELSREQALRSLELLIGRYPAAAIAPAEMLGRLGQRVPTGLPSELLERRPDVIAAEQRVAAAFNFAQEAEAARLPRFTLTASASDLSSDLFILQDRENPAWSIGGSVFAPLFNAGALRSAVDIRTAEQREAMAQYVQTALAALGDVEDALSSELALEDRETILTAAVREAERALRIAEARYRVGAGDLRRVEEQQLSYHSARMNLLRVQSERRVQRVNLHLALGGNFAPSA